MTTPPDDTIEVAGAPDVPSLRFRRVRQPADYEALTAVGNASRAADNMEGVATVEQVVRAYEHPDNSEPVKDMIVAEIDSQLVGFSRTQWSLEQSGRYRYWFGLSLLPEWRGRGIRRAMLRWIEARIRQIAATHPAGAPKGMDIGLNEKSVELIALLTEAGFRPERYFLEMIRPLDTPLPDFPMPAGLELRPVRPEHYRLIWEASNEAFRDHWGSSLPSEEDYQLWLGDKDTFQPELFQVAWDVAGNLVAGQIRTYINETENEALQRRRGYTEVISVCRPWRKRGLARAMIAESLRVLKARGMTESSLAVDSENHTGATRLYEACGFTVDYVSILFRKTIDPHPTGANP